MVLRAVASPSSAASAISACRPCPKTGHFGVPNLEKLTSVPQKQPFWDPEPRKTPSRAPKHAILGSRSQENALPCPKTCHFGIPNPENLAFVGQNRRFCPSTAGKTPLRWAKQALLSIRGRENSTSLGKTGTFAHPWQKKQHSVGQNRGFCPSTAGKTGKGGSRSQGSKGETGCRGDWRRRRKRKRKRGGGSGKG